MKIDMNLIDDWQAHGRIEMPHDEFMAWLPEQTPDTWHAIAKGWNWDYDSDALAWIVAQEQCDFGTASAVFFVEALNWMTTPTWQELDHKSYQTSWKICKTIADRWNGAGYSRAELFPDPSGKPGPHSNVQHYRRMEQRARDAGEPLAWTVPAFVDDYEGQRSHQSDYETMDGALYYSLRAWEKKRKQA